MWFARFSWDTSQQLSGTCELSGARVYRSEDGSEGCAYWMQDDRPAALAADVPLVRLKPSLVVPGASAGADAPWHYIVATDVLPQHEADFNAWYEQEHLPGLAAVPGTVQAARYVRVEGTGPRYHACYDLADRAAFNSPAWLAVRGTPWSSRVRPSFRNTQRTMYQRVA
ncbi:hypothetical protein [Azohydromonas lata]